MDNTLNLIYEKLEKNILIFPGFMGYSNEIHFTDIQRKLSKFEIETKVFDWPYFGTNMKKYLMTNTLEYLRKEVPKYMTGETIFYGISLGGVIATILATEFKIKKLIIVASPYRFCTGDDMSEIVEDWRQAGKFTFKSSKYGQLDIPFSFVDDAQKYNAKDFITKIEIPKYFIAGEKDVNVPKALTKELHDIAIEPKEWTEIKDMIHGFKNNPVLLEKVNSEIIQRIKKA